VSRRIESGPSREQTGPTADDVDLGETLRALRTAAGLTLESLAAAAGVSKSLLSQVERGQTSPSVATLRGVAAALGVPVAVLFLDPEATVQEVHSPERRMVVRSDRRPRVASRRSDVYYELLTPDSARQIEFLYGEMQPGQAAPAEEGAYVAHDGEENVLCTGGTITFLIGAHEFEIREGDSISFDPSGPHRIENRGDDVASMIIAITPPIHLRMMARS
jgi:transcriptional regulator with XRE-family HTH domain